MSTFPIAAPNKILFAGDWHGDAWAVAQMLEYAREQEVDVIIQLGDFGLWPGESGASYLKKVKTLALRFKIPILWIDGNHEDFPQLTRKALDPLSGLRKYSEYLYHLPRNYRWEWDGVIFHALGGATSLDRLNRVEGIDWWSGEAITAEEAKVAQSLGGCDVLLLHDCPEGVKIPGIDRLSSLRYWPESTLREAWAHREQLASICSKLEPKMIFHGHFHYKYYTEAVLGSSYATRVNGLADNTCGVRANSLIYTLENLKRDIESIETRGLT
jgi:Icc-related predicted phosphoesterase